MPNKDSRSKYTNNSTDVPKSRGTKPVKRDAFSQPNNGTTKRTTTNPPNKK